MIGKRKYCQYIDDGITVLPDENFPMSLYNLVDCRFHKQPPQTTILQPFL